MRKPGKENEGDCKYEREGVREGEGGMVRACWRWRNRGEENYSGCINQLYTILFPSRSLALSPYLSLSLFSPRFIFICLPSSFLFSLLCFFPPNLPPVAWTASLTSFFPLFCLVLIWPYLPVESCFLIRTLELLPSLTAACCRSFR